MIIVHNATLLISECLAPPAINRRSDCSQNIKIMPTFHFTFYLEEQKCKSVLFYNCSGKNDFASKSECEVACIHGRAASRTLYSSNRTDGVGTPLLSRSQKTTPGYLEHYIFVILCTRLLSL